MPQSYQTFQINFLFIYYMKHEPPVYQHPVQCPMSTVHLIHTMFQKLALLPFPDDWLSLY